MDRPLPLDHAANLLCSLRTGHLLHRRRDDVTDAGIAPPMAALDADHQDLPRARVVGHAHACLVLDHGYLALSTTCTSRQRLECDRGRLSRTITVSPTWASLLS